MIHLVLDSHTSFELKATPFYSKDLSVSNIYYIYNTKIKLVKSTIFLTQGTRMLQTIKNLHYKEIFLYGSLYSYIAGMFLTIVFGIGTHNFYTVLFAFLSAMVVMGDTLYYKRYKNYMLTSVVLLWNSVAFIYFRILFYDFGLDVAFLLIPPMVASILLNKKHLFLFSFLYILLTVVLLWYGYIHYEEHLFLHNKSFLITFGIFSFFVVTFGFIYHYSIEQSYIKLEKSDKTKSLLLKEVHHRVKNNLNMMTSILGLQTYKYKSPQIQEFIEQNTLRINSISLLHELLYQDNDIENTHVKQYVEQLAHHILILSKNKNISLHLEIEELPLNISDLIHIGIIVNELMTNSLKHAFTQAHGHIDISLTRSGQQYLLSYSDNGKGVDTLEVEEEGFGFSLILLSVEHLCGRFSLQDKEGFACDIYFKGTDE